MRMRLNTKLPRTMYNIVQNRPNENVSASAAPGIQPCKHCHPQGQAATTATLASKNGL